jgi:hypothetical protein
MLFAWYNRDSPPYFLGICLELRHTRSAPGLSISFPHSLLRFSQSPPADNYD